MTTNKSWYKPSHFHRYQNSGNSPFHLSIVLFSIRWSFASSSSLLFLFWYTWPPKKAPIQIPPILYHSVESIFFLFPFHFQLDLSFVFFPAYHEQWVTELIANIYYMSHINITAGNVQNTATPQWKFTFLSQNHYTPFSSNLSIFTFPSLDPFSEATICPFYNKCAAVKHETKPKPTRIFHSWSFLFLLQESYAREDSIIPPPKSPEETNKKKSKLSPSTLLFTNYTLLQKKSWLHVLFVLVEATEGGVVQDILAQVSPSFLIGWKKKEESWKTPKEKHTSHPTTVYVELFI